MTDLADHAVRDVLLDARGLVTEYSERSGVFRGVGRRRAGNAIKAVDGVDLQIERGGIAGLVGESGCGKTTLGRTILGLTPAAAGTVTFDGESILGARGRRWRTMRRRMQMVFQDPHASLSPRFRVSQLLVEPYTINKVPAGEQRSVRDLLEMVGLSDAQATKFPHELSGGQARRIGLARALALQPQLIIADEPTSGLDVSAAASVLNLMRSVATQHHLSYLLITHNVSLLSYIADTVSVMYLGQFVETAPTEQLLAAPAHPYTQALVGTVPKLAVQRRQRVGQMRLAAGEIPSPRNPPLGCRFHTRCPLARQRCIEEAPRLEEIAPGHHVRCHYWRDAQQGLVSTNDSRDGASGRD